jgi:hypothetical protein
MIPVTAAPHKLLSNARLLIICDIEGPSFSIRARLAGESFHLNLPQWKWKSLYHGASED